METEEGSAKQIAKRLDEKLTDDDRKAWQSGATTTYVTVASPDGIFYGKGAILESAVDFEAVKIVT